MVQPGIKNERIIDKPKVDKPLVKNPRAKKRFGQHFLKNQKIINRIIKAVAPQPGQSIIEIGPGKGALTGPLLEHLGKIHVLEIDSDLAQLLAKKYQYRGQIHIHCLDALNYDFTQLGVDDLRIVGNLPYNISTPLVFHLLRFHHCIGDMILMLQEEVAARICSEPGSKRYGRLSVMVQTYCYTKKLFTIAPEAFYPRPQVSSAIISLKPYNKFLANISDPVEFAQLVKQAFSHRRKTLQNCLKGLLDERQIRNLGIDPKARADTLSVADFVTLSNIYHKLHCG